jgi:uncharacterized protein (TIGR02246 family)
MKKSMNSKVSAFIIIILGCTLQVFGQTAKDTADIMAILKAHETNWNKHDMNLWAEMLHEDADWVNWRGGYWHGKAAIKAGHEKIHRSYYKNTVLSPQRVEDMVFLTPEIVLAHVRSELSGDERTPGEIHPYRKTFVFTKKSGKWGVRALHNTRLLDEK